MQKATDRLYYEKSDLLEFSARVVAHQQGEERIAVVLDRSAFYPESGGQMADHGTLGSVPVQDVQVDADGVVRHFVSGPAPEIGSDIRGVIDADRRRTFTALHTGQHLLSRALLTVLKADTVSSRLGETECNIDLTLERAKDSDLQEAEALVNAVIDADVAIRSFFPTPEALASMDLRRSIKVTDRVRVVEVEGFDRTPCGGTHCTRSAQIGLVRILRTERVKGRLRVLFVCGPRARRQLFADQKNLYALAQGFTCGPSEIDAAVERLRSENKVLKKALRNSRHQLAETTAAELLRRADAEAATEVVASFDDADAAFLQVVAERLTLGSRVALLAAPSDLGTQVLLARGPDSNLDCGALLKAAAASTGGKGGGKPDLAQGRLPGRVDWAKLMAALPR